MKKDEKVLPQFGHRNPSQFLEPQMEADCAVTRTRPRWSSFRYLRTARLASEADDGRVIRISCEPEGWRNLQPCHCDCPASGEEMESAVLNCYRIPSIQ